MKNIISIIIFIQFFTWLNIGFAHNEVNYEGICSFDTVQEGQCQQISNSRAAFVQSIQSFEKQILLVTGPDNRQR